MIFSPRTWQDSRILGFSWRTWRNWVIRLVVLALLLGEKQTLDPLIKQQFAQLGLAHLLAISGLHIAIVAGLAFALALAAAAGYAAFAWASGALNRLNLLRTAEKVHRR